MPNFQYMLNSFRSGEIGPKTHARTDTTQYTNGLDTLENFLPETSGGAFRRGGLTVERTPDIFNDPEKGETYSIVYQYDINSVYRLDLRLSSDVPTHTYASIDSFETVNANSTPAYDAGSESNLSTQAAKALQEGLGSTHQFSYIQVENVIVLVHSSGDMEPIIFVPVLDSSGELSLLGFAYTQTISDASITTLLGSTPDKILLSYNNWARLELGFRSPTEDPNVTGTTMEFGGTSGTVSLTSSTDYFVAEMASDSGASNGHLIMIDDGTEKQLLGVISAVTDAQNATAEIIGSSSGVTATASDYWYAGNWDKYNGWPKTVELHDGRLLFAGTKRRPTTLWGSYPFAFGQFSRYLAFDTATTGTYARVTSDVDGGVEYTLASEGEKDSIAWLKSSRTLLLGTSSKEYAVSLSSTNLSFSVQSNHGGSAVPAVNAYNSTYFIGQNGRDVYEVRYSEENGSFISRRLTDINDQILFHNSNSKNAKYIQLVYVDGLKTIFALTDEGAIIGITLDPRAEVLAFSKVKTESAHHYQIFKAFDPFEEETFLFTRTTNSESNLDDYEWILRLTPAWDNTAPLIPAAANLNDWCVFLDFSLYGVDFSGTTTLSLGLAYASMDLTVFGKDFTTGDLNQYEVTANSSGVVTLPDTLVSWVVGLKYTSTLKTLTIEVGPNQIMNSQGDILRIDRATAKLYNSWVGKYGSDSSTYDIEALNQNEAFTGEVRLDVPLGPDNENKVIIETDKPLPLNILGLVLRGTNNP